MNLSDNPFRNSFNDSSTKQNEKEKTIYLYDVETNFRSITFIFPTGDRKTIYYHNILKHEYYEETDTVQILSTSGEFKIRGKNLLLFDKYLKKYKISDIHLYEQRYAETINLDDNEIIIFSIEEI